MFFIVRNMLRAMSMFVANKEEMNSIVFVAEVFSCELPAFTHMDWIPVRIVCIP